MKNVIQAIRQDALATIIVLVLLSLLVGLFAYYVLSIVKPVQLSGTLSPANIRRRAMQMKKRKDKKLEQEIDQEIQSLLPRNTPDTLKKRTNITLQSTTDVRCLPEIKLLQNGKNPHHVRFSE